MGGRGAGSQEALHGKMGLMDDQSGVGQCACECVCVCVSVGRGSEWVRCVSQNSQQERVGERAGTG